MITVTWTMEIILSSDTHQHLSYGISYPDITKKGTLLSIPCVTTFDVAREMLRKGIIFDIAPRRIEVISGDARNLPLGDDSVEFVFLDPPYSDSFRFSDHTHSLDRFSLGQDEFFVEIGKIAAEIHRILKHSKVVA